MTDLRDLLCDACLYKVETESGVHLCDRCWKKMLRWWKSVEEHERLLGEWEEPQE